MTGLTGVPMTDPLINSVFATSCKLLLKMKGICEIALYREQLSN